MTVMCAVMDLGILDRYLNYGSVITLDKVDISLTIVEILYIVSHRVVE